MTQSLRNSQKLRIFPDYFSLVWNFLDISVHSSHEGLYLGCRAGNGMQKLR